MANNDKKAKAAMKAWKKRWELVREKQVEVLRNTPPEIKLQQLAALYASRHLFDQREQREREVAEVRAKWMKVHKLYEKKK